MLPDSINPSKISTDLVRSYYYVEFDQSRELNSGVIIDDACYELMFVKEKNVKIITGNDEVFDLAPAYTLNNLPGPFKFDFSGSFSTFCIKLQPWMNASYVPIKKSQLLNLNELYPEHMDSLHHKLFSSESLEEMRDHAESFLSQLSIGLSQETELVKNICEVIYEKSGDISVNEIAETFSIYRQKLNALFKEQVKYTLKSFINYVRIRACLDYKLRNPDILLTQIGHKFGYFDQAHFIRSFKTACGVTPSEYVNTPGYSFQTIKPSK